MPPTPKRAHSAQGPIRAWRMIVRNIVDAARSTGPSASLDFGRTWLYISSDPTWIRILKENWKVLFKVGPHLKFHYPILASFLSKSTRGKTSSGTKSWHKPKNFTKKGGNFFKKTIKNGHERHQDTYERHLGAKRGSKGPKRAILDRTVGLILEAILAPKPSSGRPWASVGRFREHFGAPLDRIVAGVSFRLHF